MDKTSSNKEHSAYEVFDWDGFYNGEEYKERMKESYAEYDRRYRDASLLRLRRVLTKFFPKK